MSHEICFVICIFFNIFVLEVLTHKITSSVQTCFLMWGYVTIGIIIQSDKHGNMLYSHMCVKNSFDFS
jgi:hypothetical protein